MKSDNHNIRWSTRIVTMIFLTLLVCTVSCRKPQNNTLRPDAVDLYHKSVALIKLYSDSMNHASDSLSLLELQERFTNALTALNFKYPSETCLEISEGENDTLTNLTEKIVELKDSLLYRFGHPLEASDSLASDSLSGNVKDTL